MGIRRDPADMSMIGSPTAKTRQARIRPHPLLPCLQPRLLITAPPRVENLGLSRPIFARRTLAPPRALLKW